MAKSFTITTSITDTLKADGKGHAAAVFIVTNATGRPVRGMAKAKTLDNTKKEWLSTAGENDRDFAPGGVSRLSDGGRPPNDVVAFGLGDSRNVPLPAALRSTSQKPESRVVLSRAKRSLTF